MAIVRALSKRTIAQRFKDAQEAETVWDEIRDETQALATRIIQSGLEEELTMRLYATRYGRSRQRRGWRMGVTGVKSPVAGAFSISGCPERAASCRRPRSWAASSAGNSRYE